MRKHIKISTVENGDLQRRLGSGSNITLPEHVLKSISKMTFEELRLRLIKTGQVSIY